MKGRKRTPLTQTGRRNLALLVLVMGLITVARLIAVRHQFRLPAELAFETFDVAFTNPDCETYAYATPVSSLDGTLLLQKPKNAFCSKPDLERTRERADLPLRRLLDWIAAPGTREIFIATLSMNSELVADALCAATRDRDVRVTVVYDVNQAADAAARLPGCVSRVDPTNRPVVITQGSRGGIEYTHDKFILINGSAEVVRLAFGSGNISKGLDLSHENWDFVTLRGDSYFAASHRCAAGALVANAESVGAFTTAMEACRSRIQKPREVDIQSFFVPADADAARFALADLLRDADDIRVAAHVLTLPMLVDQLTASLTRSPPARVRLILDDDAFWADRGQERGPMGHVDAAATARLVALGAELRYLETNESESLLQHNKFVLAHQSTGPWLLFTGAGNFSSNAFRANFENFYRIGIPHVVSAYRAQFDHLFELATPPARMPATVAETIRVITPKTGELRRAY